MAQLIAVPAREFPQFAEALAEIDTLDARVADITALCDASVTPAGSLVSFDYLLAMTRAELCWLRDSAGAQQRR